MPRLRKVRPGVDLGYRRVRAGEAFRYTDADGAALPADERERVVALVIPPAWSEVWISAAPNGHIQATGIDDAGRLQYLYHPDWVAGRDKGKYAHPRGAARRPHAGQRRPVDRDLAAGLS